jgi:hypothetical protein
MRWGGEGLLNEGADCFVVRRCAPDFLATTRLTRLPRLAKREARNDLVLSAAFDSAQPCAYLSCHLISMPLAAAFSTRPLRFTTLRKIFGRS